MEHHGVASPALGPMARKGVPQPRSLNLASSDPVGLPIDEDDDEHDEHGEQEALPPLQVPERSASARSLRRGSPVRRRLSVGLRAKSFGTLYYASLGEVAKGTTTAESQCRELYEVDDALEELAALAQGGHAQAATLLDVFDALETATDEAGLRYLCDSLLCTLPGSSSASAPQSPKPVADTAANANATASTAANAAASSALSRRACTQHMLDYCLTRTMLLELKVLMHWLIDALTKVSGHIDFWQELEERPWRLRLVLAVHACPAWTSLEDTLGRLENLCLRYLSHLGRLKALALGLEDHVDASHLRSLTHRAMQEVASVLDFNPASCDSDSDSDSNSASNSASNSRPSASRARSRAWSSTTATVGSAHAHCQGFLAALALRKEEFARSVAGIEELPRYVKYWPEIAACGAVAAGLLALGAMRRSEAHDFVRRAAQSFAEFLGEHVTRPLAALVDEVVFDHTLQVADVAAMQDAKESLGRMLSSYVQDTSPHVGSEELARIVETLDVSVLSRQYESELRQPITSLVSGDLVRMLLIQMHHTKKELLVILSTLDELMRENQFNIQVMALIPSVVIAASVQQLGVQLLWAVRGTKRSKRYVFRHARLLLRDVEQILNAHLKSHHQGRLKGIALGRLVLQLHLLETLLVSNQDLFDRHQRRRLTEDVAELISDHLDAQQKLNTIARVHRSYDFLAAADLHNSIVGKLTWA